jgi:hypothetical protein
MPLRLVRCPNQRDGRRCNQPLAELRLGPGSVARVRCPACKQKATWLGSAGWVVQPALLAAA